VRSIRSSLVRSLLILGLILNCRPGVEITRTHRTLAAALAVPAPFVYYHDSIITIRFDTSHAFRAIQAVLHDTSESRSGLKQRYRRQLDSARASLQRGAQGWPLSDNYVFDYLLRTTPFWALDQRTHDRLPRLELEDYEEHCGAMCGYGERRFRLPDGTLFLKLLLWVS
jgi:hypothetical protein